MLRQHVHMFASFNIDADLRNVTQQYLDELIASYSTAEKARVLKKLTELYGGTLAVPKPIENYINLSSQQLDEDEIEFLNLGLNCHVCPKFNITERKANIALLYEDLCKLQKENKISMNSDIQEQLQAETTNIRCKNSRSAIVTPRLKAAASRLLKNEDIVIRRADKSSTYVILDRDVYMDKCNTILADETKFQQINKNNINNVKKKLNSIITAANAVVGGIKFQPVTGDYNMGYFYGNVKTHKDNNPLRPIISQIPTPTYSMAKKLNELIKPYIPATYSLKSTKEFIDIITANRPEGMIASLDVSSLFTNIPVVRTIDIILKYVYEHPDIPALKIPKTIMKSLLEICTMECSFRSPEGKMYVQRDGVAMGSPLGVLFAEAFMADVESDVIGNIGKPQIYCRYIDDIFVCSRDIAELTQLKNALQEKSGLTFTTELSNDNKIPFLDVLVDASGGDLITSVYRKPTDTGVCLNGGSECTETYKNSVIRAYIFRALKLSSTWNHFHRELVHIRQMLINNGYTNRAFDNIVNRTMEKYVSQTGLHSEQQQTIKLYFHNTFHAQYKKDEKQIKDIISRNCRTIDNAYKLQVIIYYRNLKTSSMVMRNNITDRNDMLSKTNVVYQYKCKSEECAPHNISYIGQTTCTLSRRMTYHFICIFI